VVIKAREKLKPARLKKENCFPLKLIALILFGLDKLIFGNHSLESRPLRKYFNRKNIRATMWGTFAGSRRSELASVLIRTPGQRLRVFISSTLHELATERKAARESIEQLRLMPVFFEAGVRPYQPRELYRAYLEQCEIFVGIYWQNYRWVAPDMKISGLEDGFLRYSSFYQSGSILGSIIV
jgi:hypothetical protein